MCNVTNKNSAFFWLFLLFLLFFFWFKRNNDYFSPSKLINFSKCLPVGRWKEGVGSSFVEERIQTSFLDELHDLGMVGTALVDLGNDGPLFGVDGSNDVFDNVNDAVMSFVIH